MLVAYVLPSVFILPGAQQPWGDSHHPQEELL